jgi:hypothetical protein
LFEHDRQLHTNFAPLCHVASYAAVYAFSVDRRLYTEPGVIDGLIAISKGGDPPPPLSGLFRAKGVRIITTLLFGAHFAHTAEKRHPKVSVHPKQINDHWVSITFGDCEPLAMELAADTRPNPQTISPLFIELSLRDVSEITTNRSRLITLWNEIIGHKCIPFQVSERTKALSHAFQILAPYIDAHTAMLDNAST